MFRVTNRMMYENTLINVMRQNEGMLKWQEQISSGKRVNRPSDDPVSMGEILKFQTRLDRNDRYESLGVQAEAFLNTSDSLIGDATQLAVRANELALSMANGTASAQTRQTTAVEISTMIQRAIQVGNSSIGSDYIFGGRQTNLVPITTNGLYSGDHTQLTAEVNQNVIVNMSVLASEFLTADMNPQLNSATPIAQLNGGTGVAAGTFTVTDRAGGTGSVTVNAGDTVGTVIAAINASGANVTAGFSADGMSITITDNNTSVTGPLVISDTSGTPAADLGIAGSRPLSSFTGDDLNPDVTGTTLLSDLYGGGGLTLNDIIVRNGAASATVTFAGATTVADVLTALNASPTNITAALNANGTAVTITSNNAATVAYAVEAGTGNTAELLGIGGGRNLIPILQRLEQAMLLNDVSAIAGLVDNLNSSVDTTTALRGQVGARANLVLATRTSIEQSNFDTKTMLSNAQDADMPKAVSELALLQTAYQATIKSSAS
ncbi:MAG: flagellar hook-associated protein FlgL, partial [Nitrospinota bacterium]